MIYLKVVSPHDEIETKLHPVGYVMQRLCSLPNQVFFVLLAVYCILGYITPSLFGVFTMPTIWRWARNVIRFCRWDFLVGWKELLALPLGLVAPALCCLS